MILEADIFSAHESNDAVAMNAVSEQLLALSFTGIAQGSILLFPIFNCQLRDLCHVASNTWYPIYRPITWSRYLRIHHF